MKKILYVTNIPAPYTVEFFNDLGERFDLTVVFEENNSAERDSSWENFKAIHFKCKIINKKKIGLLRIPIRIRQILNERRYDLYIIGNYSTPTGMVAISWLRQRKMPYAIHADGGLISNDSNFRYWIKRYFIKNANMYFSSGKMTSKYFEYYGAEKRLIREYPFSSVRMNQIRGDYDNDAYRRRLGLNPKEKIIVSVGQIIPRKGFDVLIEAISMLKSNAKLYIIGGEATEDLSKLVNDFRLVNIEFMPFLHFQTVLEYMAAADLFVLLTREDIWGLVINEAFSMGAPVISTNKCVAAVEMIEEGVNGYVIESENPKMAAEHMDYLLGDDELRKKIHNNNIEKAKLFTIEKMCDTYSDIINRFFKDESIK